MPTLGRRRPHAGDHPARPEHAAHDGREALAEIKADPELRKIPVVVLTTSKADEDIVRTYDLGVNSFITKPVTFTALVEVMQTWSRYWFEIVDLPGEARLKGDLARPS